MNFFHSDFLWSLVLFLSAESFSRGRDKNVPSPADEDPAGEGRAVENQRERSCQRLHTVLCGWTHGQERYTIHSSTFRYVGSVYFVHNTLHWNDFIFMRILYPLLLQAVDCGASVFPSGLVSPTRDDVPVILSKKASHSTPIKPLEGKASIIGM